MKLTKTRYHYKGDSSFCHGGKCSDLEQNHNFGIMHVELPVDLCEGRTPANSMQDIPGGVAYGNYRSEAVIRKNGNFHIEKDHLLAKQFKKTELQMAN